jgi:hypothetical protein
MGKKLTDCINQVFSKVITGVNGKTASGANLLKPQTLSSAPTINREHSASALGGGRKLVAGSIWPGDESIGPNGQIRMASDLGSFGGLELYQRTYVHELGNKLSRQISGNGKTFGDPAGITSEDGGDPDDDTGAKLEKCVFGNVKG